MAITMVMLLVLSLVLLDLVAGNGNSIVNKLPLPKKPGFLGTQDRGLKVKSFLLLLLRTL